MDGLLNWLTNYCINNELISKDNEAWFRYGLEKRLCTLVVLVPFIFMAVCLSGFWTALFYIISFFYLHSQTNGYHSKTHIGCFTVSLLLELFFLVAIKPMMNATWILILVSISVVVVFALAPYNHPMMSLGEHEYAACKRAARIRCILLALFCFGCLLCGFHSTADGITLGCAMTSTLLVFAKITERRRRYESIEDHGEQCASHIIQQND